MDPKFLVIEIDSKEQALQLVQIMLEKGFARLMLLDDLVKHPTLGSRTKSDDTRDAGTSTTPEEADTDYQEEVSFSMISRPTKTEDVEAVDEEEELPIDDTRRGVKRSHELENDAEEPDYSQQLMSMLSAKPQIVPIGVTTSKPKPSASGGSKKKPPATGVYHECQLCGVRVRTPRGGRWNLQMHAIALHCVGRQYRCRECPYLDYRKSSMRRHTSSQHGEDIPPHDISDNDMKKEFHDTMIKCFPAFADRTGFLN